MIIICVKASEFGLVKKNYIFIAGFLVTPQLPYPTGVGTQQLHQRQRPQVLSPPHSRHGGVRAEDPAHEDRGCRLLRVPSGRRYHHL